MLRAQAFEGLFTLVPILLVAVVSIVLRARSAKKRKQREEAAQAEGTQAPAAKPPARPGSKPSPSTARGASRLSRRAIPPRRERRDTRTAPFPWQRETSDAASTPPAPLTPSPPRRAQAQLRDSYAYPPPLPPGEDGASAAAAAQSAGAPFPRPVVRPTVESRMAAARMAAPKQEKSLRERMQALTKSDRPSAKAPAGGPSAITAKLQKLPPLKRAVIWAELLGPPGGRQQ